MTPDNILDLHTARNAHAGASRLAARAWKLITKLHETTLLMPVDLALNRVAEAIYYSAGYNACERYETIEEFKEALKEDLDGAFETVAHDGKPHYAVKPFFNAKSEFLGQLGLSYLHGYTRIDELSGLDVTSRAAWKKTDISGLSPDEEQVLVAHHRSQAIELVNLLRKCQTALHYIGTGLQNRHNSAPGYADTVKSADIPHLVLALVTAVRLPFTPAPTDHFSSESDKTNLLRTLPGGPGLDALLAVH